MKGTLVMAREYYKPNMNNLRGKRGMAIMEELRTAKKPDDTVMKAKADELRKRMLAMKNNK